MSAPATDGPVRKQAKMSHFFQAKPPDNELKEVEAACHKMNEGYKAGKIKPAASNDIGRSKDAIRMKKKRDAEKVAREAAKRRKAEREKKAAAAAAPAAAPEAAIAPALMIEDKSAAAAAPTTTAGEATKKTTSMDNMCGIGGKKERKWTAQERGMVIAAVERWGLGKGVGAQGTNDKPNFSFAARKLRDDPLTKHLFGVGSLKKPDGARFA